MNVHGLRLFCKGVLVMAEAELAKKAPDYAPDDICFVDLIRQCAEADIPRPEQLLWALMSKHTTALGRYCQTGTLDSETLGNRVIDTINYAAILYVWHLQSLEILRTVWAYHAAQPCVCDGNDPCPLHQVQGWYAKYQPSFRTDSTSAAG